MARPSPHQRVGLPRVGCPVQYYGHLITIQKWRDRRLHAGREHILLTRVRAVTRVKHELPVVTKVQFIDGSIHLNTNALVLMVTRTHPDSDTDWDTIIIIHRDIKLHLKFALFVTVKFVTCSVIISLWKYYTFNY